MQLAVGCGGSDLARVTGQVARSDGTPLVGATVTFKATDPAVTARPSGQTDEAGRFELRFDEDRLGAPPGEYRVTVSEALGDDMDAPPKPTIDRKYSSFERSGLEYTVESGHNEFEIAVDPPQR